MEIPPNACDAFTPNFVKSLKMVSVTLKEERSKPAFPISPKVSRATYVSRVSDFSFDI